MRTWILFFLLGICTTTVAMGQKAVYIPAYLRDTNTVDGKQFSLDKTYQTENFILIWGSTVGTDPANYVDPDLRFNPKSVLDTMEFIYTRFKSLGFMDDSPGTNLSKYKVVIVIYGTWGPDGAQGFANGGDVDGVIGAFWVHPNGIRDGGVAAHEFAHSMQAQNTIDYRNTHGLGGSWYNAGIFWETHANYMRNLIYPNAVGAWGMDVYHLETWGDWKNTYENYQLLMALAISEGPEMVSRLWRESDSFEYPLQTYKRINGYSQARFNDSLYLYARRMACYDFDLYKLGVNFRNARRNDLMYSLQSIHATYNILRRIPGSTDRYEMPIEQAPEEFAYNIIPLHLNPDSCAAIVKFKGHTEANAHAGWRYGFVAAHPDGTVSRYSPTYHENEAEIHFALEGDENALYLVVMGAPFDQITTTDTNNTWFGYPKHFRFPYELSIKGALPEGFQTPENFRAQLKNDGHVHVNGGGWVQNSANVAASVYVGPHAIVLGNSQISGNVRINHTAIVRDATISGNVQILDNAVVTGGNYAENAIVRGHAYVENVQMKGHALIGMRAVVINYKLSGTVEVGGDVIVYNDQGDCDNGVHYRLTNYYDNKFLECDGRTAEHPDNKDVNNTYNLFTESQMKGKCNCANLPDCNTVSSTHMPLAINQLSIYPNPALETFQVILPENAEIVFPARVQLADLSGRIVRTQVMAQAQEALDLSRLEDGVYTVRLGDYFGRIVKIKN